MLTDVSDANKSYTKLEVAEKSDLDLIAVKVLRKDCPDFLFPLKMMEIDGETEIRIHLPRLRLERQMQEGELRTC